MIMWARKDFKKNAAFEEWLRFKDEREGRAFWMRRVIWAKAEEGM